MAGHSEPNVRRNISEDLNIESGDGRKLQTSASVPALLVDQSPSSHTSGEANASIQLSLSSDYNVKDTTVGGFVDDMKAGMTVEDVDMYNEDDIISDHGSVSLNNFSVGGEVDARTPTEDIHQFQPPVTISLYSIDKAPEEVVEGKDVDINATKDQPNNDESHLEELPATDSLPATETVVQEEEVVSETPVVSKDDGKDGVTLNQGKKTPTPKKKKIVKTAPVKLANIITTKSSAQQKTIANKVTKRLAKTRAESQPESQANNKIPSGKKTPLQRTPSGASVTPEVNGKSVKGNKKATTAPAKSKKPGSFGKMISDKVTPVSLGKIITDKVKPVASKWNNPSDFTQGKPKDGFTTTGKDDKELLMKDEANEPETIDGEANEDEELAAQLKESHLNLPKGNNSRRESCNSSRSNGSTIIFQQIPSTVDLNAEKPKVVKEIELMPNNGSYMRAAIPYLPVPLAITCLVMNVILPGSGTVLSGFSVLCFGRPRIEGKDDQVFKTVFINLIVGIGQLLTILFVMVGWFWSIAWGINLVILSRSYQQLKRYEHELEQLSSLEAQSTSTPSAS